MNCTNRTITVDDEFKSLIPPLAPEELELLRDSLKTEGCRDPIVVWKEESILLDGHNRHDICSQLGLPFKIVELSLKDRTDAIRWMILNQIGRRNITAYDRAKLALKLEPVIAERAKENQRAMGGPLCQKADKVGFHVDTKREVAKTANVSHDTIAKVKLIESHAAPETKAALSRGEVSIHAAYKEVKKQQKISEPRPSTNVQSELFDTTEYLDDLIHQKRQFGCIYANPSWPSRMQREKAANEVEDFKDPLSIISSLPVERLALDDCQLHLWANNSSLADALEVMKSWGFTYKSTFVWVRPQVGTGNYWQVSHDLLLLGSRGKASFLAQDKRSWGEFSNLKGNAKPEAIRRLIEEVSQGPFLELFGSKTVPGWTVWSDRSKSLCAEDPARQTVESAS